MATSDTSASAPTSWNVILQSAVFASGNFAALIFGLAAGLLTARILDPITLGQFNAFMIVLGYTESLQLGILNGLSREVPVLIGQGRIDESHHLAAVAQWFTLTTATVLAVLLLSISAWHLWQHNLVAALGWATCALLGFLQFFSDGYLQVTYRVSGRFSRLALVFTISQFVNLCLVAVVWVWGFAGLCLRASVAGISRLVLTWHDRPIRVTPVWNSTRFAQLLRVGLPIFAVGQIGALWPVLNVTLILALLGPDGLGLYSVAIVVGNAVGVFGTGMSSVIYPAMARVYGESGRLHDVLMLTIRPQLLLMTTMILALIIGWWSLPYAIEFVLPKYVGGIGAARWTLVVQAVSSLALVNNVFNVIRRQDLYARSLLAGVAVYVLALSRLTRDTVNLAQFPRSMAIGQIALLAYAYASVIYLWRQERRGTSEA